MKQKIVEKIYEQSEKSRKTNMVKVSSHTSLFKYSRDTPPPMLNARFKTGAHKS